MKKYLFLIAVALLVFIPSKVMAAPIEIASTDFDSALAGTPSNGVSYNSTEEYYSLAAGEYKLTSDISIAGKFILLSENVTLDLNGKSITSNYVTTIIKIIEDAEVTIGGGSVEIVDWDSGCAIQAYNNAKLTLTNGAFIAPFGIVLYDNSETTINAGTITDVVLYQNAVLTVNAGEIENLYVHNTSNATINNGAITSINADGQNVENISTIVINNGMVNSISVMYSDLTINNGEFVSEYGSSLVILSGANVAIKGGTFVNSGFAAVVAESPEIRALKISGGTFKGPRAGLLSESGVNVELTGGKFEATAPGNTYGAITFLQTSDTTILARILGDGYTYNPTLIASVSQSDMSENLVHSQSKIEVVSTLADGNPSTLDNIGTFISIAILATTALFGTIVVSKKVIKVN